MHVRKNQDVPAPAPCDATDTGGRRRETQEGARDVSVSRGPCQPSGELSQADDLYGGVEVSTPCFSHDVAMCAPPMTEMSRASRAVNLDPVLHDPFLRISRIWGVVFFPSVYQHRSRTALGIPLLPLASSYSTTGKHIRGRLTMFILLAAGILGLLRLLGSLCFLITKYFWLGNLILQGAFCCPPDSYTRSPATLFPCSYRLRPVTYISFGRKSLNTGRN